MRFPLTPLLLLALLALPLLGPAPHADDDVAEHAQEHAQLPQRDYERVREAVARGEMVPLEDILEDAQRRYPGRVLEVELEGNEYEVEILGDDGVIMEFEYDARTGELLEVEVDD